MPKLSDLKLAPADRALIKKIALLSIAGCALVVAASWGVQTMKLRKARLEALAVSPTTKTLSEYYRESTGALLPVDIQAHEWSAQHAMQTDQPAEAIRHLVRILPLRRNDRSLRLELGTAYLQSGQYADAYAVLMELAQLDTVDSCSESVDARLGLTLYYLGKPTESIEYLENSLKKHTRSAEIRCYLGEVEASFNSSSPKAEQYFLEAIDWNKDFAEAWYQLARYYMANGKYEKSRAHLLHVLDIEPLHVKAHSRLGMAYYYLQQFDLAKKSYQTALALSPNDYNTLYNLGELYYVKLDDPQSALIEYKKTLRIKPDHVLANFRVGLICLANGMNKEAVGYLALAREVEPQNTPVLLQLAVAYEKLGMKAQALEVYGAILGYDALNPIAQQKVKLLSANAP